MHLRTSGAVFAVAGSRRMSHKRIRWCVWNTLDRGMLPFAYVGLRRR